MALAGVDFLSVLGALEERDAGPGSASEARFAVRTR